jgi:glycosyltransferase involved in cell wall biosynthesis
MWYIWQRSALQRATAFHATSSDEANDIRSAGFKQPIAVVANGVSIPDTLPKRSVRPGSPKRLLFLSRLHPVKGVKELLQAFKRASIPSDWQLSLVGPGEGNYAIEVKQLCEELKLGNQVEFVGNVSDNDKWQYYVDADLFVLPSFSENFGIVIAEAMAAGLPVITTTGTPWKCIRDEKLGWWVPVNVEQIAGALRDATALPLEQLQRIGTAGSEYVRTHLSWDRSARDLLDFYSSL